MSTTKKQLLTTKNIVLIAMLAAVSTVLYMLVELPIVPFAPHLKVNFADVPAFLAGILITPVASVFVVGVRCVIHLMKTTTVGIGELIDFLIGVGFVLPASWVFLRAAKKWKLGLAYLFAALVGIVSCIIVGGLANLALFPVFQCLVLGADMDWNWFFLTYLIGTVVNNTVRSVFTFVPCLLLLPFLMKFRRMVISNV